MSSYRQKIYSREIAWLVHKYLGEQRFSRTLEAFRSEAEPLLNKGGKEVPTADVKDLRQVIQDYVSTMAALETLTEHHSKLKNELEAAKTLADHERCRSQGLVASFNQVIAAHEALPLSPNLQAPALGCTVSPQQPVNREGGEASTSGSREKRTRKRRRPLQLTTPVVELLDSPTVPAAPQRPNCTTGAAHAVAAVPIEEPRSQLDGSQDKIPNPQTPPQIMSTPEQPPVLHREQDGGQDAPCFLSAYQQGAGCEAVEGFSCGQSSPNTRHCAGTRGTKVSRPLDFDPPTMLEVPDWDNLPELPCQDFPRLDEIGLTGFQTVISIDDLTP